MRDWLPELLALPLYPLLAWQGRRTRARVPRLPEPDDEAQGVAGQGSQAPLSLLMIGESPVAGVGVQSHAEGIAAATAQALSEATGRPVQWRAIGMNGITAEEALTQLGAAIPDAQVDIACLAFGVNDSTAFRRATKWRADMQALLDLLQQCARPRLTLLSGVPPLGAFPALPAPLRQVLGLKAASLDRALGLLAARNPRTVHVPLPAALTDTGYMARDGYHPSAAGCRYWGKLLADEVPATLSSQNHPPERQPFQR